MYNERFIWKHVIHWYEIDWKYWEILQVMQCSVTGMTVLKNPVFLYTNAEMAFQAFSTDIGTETESIKQPCYLQILKHLEWKWKPWHP